MTSLLLLIALTAAPADGSVYSLSPQAFAQTARADLQTMQRFVAGMRSVMTKVDGNKSLFKKREKQVYSPEQKQTLLSTWGSLFAYFSATEGLRQKYWGFVKLPPTDPRHAWGFLLTHTALTAVLSHGLRFSELALNNPQLETLFDEPSDEYGVPRGAFAQFKYKAIHLATSTQLFTGDSWAPIAVPLLKKEKALDEAPVKWALEEMKRDSKVAKLSLLKHGGQLFAGNAKDIAVDRSMHAVFPVQKNVAEWMGDTRVARIGQPLVTLKNIETEVLPRLAPGDVLVARQNWFLSNIGLPGFWPHALLFVGTAAELAAAFDDAPDVAAWVAKQPERVTRFSALLEKRYPAKWAAYAKGVDFQGHGPIRVIESISEGVSFTAVEHAFGVDYLAGLRPRVAPVDKARAIERAFKYQGRPYDFDFDFFSDTSLVCTELVFKAYQPAADVKGLSLPLVDVAGRRTLPANELVKRFDAEGSAATRQFDFVVFLDGHEKEGRAVSTDEATLRASWKRLKWDIAQQ